MTELKILSYNTQGLGGIKKQIDVFQYIKKKNFDICCLQDTHFTESQEIYIRNRWDGNCYFSPAAQANARGVAIFFAKNVDYKIHTVKQDTEGNYLILDLSIFNKRLTLATVYGPNKDNPIFFRDLFSNIQSLENDSYIICGDFNLVLDPDLDYFNYKHVNNIKARDSILKIIDENNLFDAYRELHPSTKRYTWRIKQARLDFCLLTEFN